MSRGTRLQYLPAELQHLREVLEVKDELIEHLKGCIQGAPCLAAHPGEVTYECRAEAPCRVCRWRTEVSKGLVEEWHLTDGIW